MSMTDPIGDMLTRIRNACMARHENVDIPASKIKENIVRILQAEGYIKGYRRVEDRRQGILRLYLKYDENKRPCISGIKRVSKPGCRIYAGRKELPRVLSGLGIAIMSTPLGIMTSSACRREGVGGEVICYIW